ncbi:hypothetical protein TNCV_4579351 [Trichonephila clavipes]|nr:hypothetical protein TNCV_4579351 [Trichonephila clavipes]
MSTFKITCTTVIQTKNKYSYCCYHIILSPNATLTFHFFKNIYYVESSATNSPVSLSETKGKTKEQPSPVHRPRKDSKKTELISVKPTANLKKNPTKNTSVKIAREQDSPNESTPKDLGDGKLLKLRMPWTQTLILLTRITS